MSNDDSPPSMTSWAGLRYSIGTLVERFGRTDSVGFGLVINLGLAGICFAVWQLASGIISPIFLGLALLNVAGVVKWVIEQ